MPLTMTTRVRQAWIASIGQRVLPSRRARAIARASVHASWHSKHEAAKSSQEQPCVLRFFVLGFLLKKDFLCAAWVRQCWGTTKAAPRVAQEAQPQRSLKSRRATSLSAAPSAPSWPPPPLMEATRTCACCSPVRIW